MYCGLKIWRKKDPIIHTSIIGRRTDTTWRTLFICSLKKMNLNWKCFSSLLYFLLHYFHVCRYVCLFTLPGPLASEKQVQKFHTDDATPRRSGWSYVISMEFLCSLVRCHLAGKPVEASQIVRVRLHLKWMYSKVPARRPVFNPVYFLFLYFSHLPGSASYFQLKGDTSQCCCELHYGSVLLSFLSLAITQLRR